MINTFILFANVVMFGLFILAILILLADILIKILIHFKCDKINKFNDNMNSIKKYIYENKFLLEIIMTISIASSAISYIAENLNININL